ncbi:MAG: cold shock domain-containing protein [candidate division WOR-3 bacterium]
MKGKIRWFSSKKGYGFIDSEDGRSIFVHYSDVQSEGYKTLNEGDEVTFDIQDTDKGPKAVNVVVTKRSFNKQKTRRNRKF